MIDMILDSLSPLVGGILEEGIKWVLNVVLSFLKLTMSEFVNKFGPDLSTWFEIFPGSADYMEVFQAFAVMTMLILILLTLLASITDKSTDVSYLTLVRNFVVAAFAIFYAPSIYITVLDYANSFAKTFRDVGKEETAIPDDWVASFKNFKISDGVDTAASIVFVLLIAIVILWQYVKLILEIVERYVFLCVSLFFSPVAAAMLPCPAVSQVAGAFVKSVVSAIFMCTINLFFVNITLDALVGLAATMIEGSFVAVLVHAFMIIAVLKIAQKVDNYLNSIGLSTARCAGNMGAGLIAGAMMIGNGIKIASRGGLGVGGSAAARAARTDYAGNVHSSAARAKEANMGAGGKSVKSMDAVHAAGVANDMNMRGKNPCAMADAAALQKMRNSGVVGIDEKTGKAISAEMAKDQYGGQFRTVNPDGSVTDMSVSPIDGPKPRNAFRVETGMDDYYASLANGSAPVGGYGVEDGSFALLGDANAMSDEGTGGTFGSEVTNGLFGDGVVSDDSIMTRDGGKVSFFPGDISDTEKAVPVASALSTESGDFDAVKAANIGQYFEDSATGNKFIGFSSPNFGSIKTNAEFYACSSEARNMTGNMQNLKWTGSLVQNGRTVAETYDGKRFEFINPTMLKDGNSKGWKRVPISSDAANGYVLGRKMK